MNPHSVSGILFKTVFRLLLVVVFIGVPAGLIYLNRVGFGQAFTERVSEALGGEAYSVSIGRLVLDPFRGLVASRVEVHGEDGRRIGRISRAVVALNLSELVARRIRIESFELVRANLAIPLEEDASLVLQDVNARILLVPGFLRLTHCDFIVASVEVRLTGNFANPEAFDIERLAPTEDGTGDLTVLRDVLDALHEIKHPDGPAMVLTANVIGDLSDFAGIRADVVELRAGRVEWKDLRLQRLAVDADYRDGVFTVQHFSAEDGGGRIEGIARIDGPADLADFEFVSTFDPRPLLAQFVGEDGLLGDLVWRGNPAMDAQGQLDWSGQRLAANILGRIEAEEVHFRGVGVALLQADFAWRDGLFLTRDARIAGPAAAGTLDLLAGPGELRARFEGTVQPPAFEPLLEGDALTELRIMEFEDPLTVRVEFHAPGGELDAAEADATVRLGRTARRGAWIDSGEVVLRYQDRAVDVRSLDVRSNGGRGEAAFVYDFGREEVRIERVDSTMPPVDVMLWIDPNIAEAIRPFRFRAPPAVTGGGHVDLASMDGNRLDFRVRSTAGLRYEVIGKTLDFGTTNASIRIRGDQLNVDIPRAALFGGSARIEARVSLDPAVPYYNADITLDRVEFQPLTELYFDYDESEGWLSGQYSFRSKMDEEEQMTGEGSLLIEGGNVFAIPILGPLSVILGEILPGVGYQISRRATVDFTVGEGKIRTRNLEIEGQGFSMYGEGDINFVTDEMDMSVRINARGVPGIVFFPVSKLFEYVSLGTVSDPVWRPKRVPRQLFGTPRRNQENND